MPIYQLANEAIRPIPKTTFSQAQLQKRRDQQRLLRANISVVAPDTLVIAEEFGDWDESRRRIDLLGIDRDANLVVIELKRTEDGGHMELRAIRYAAMVSTNTFDQATDVFGR
jgi:RecB family endonuclease NucS